MEYIKVFVEFALNNYWAGVAIAFVLIFIHLKLRYTTDWELKFRKSHYWFLLFSAFSWFVPVAYLVGAIGFAVYFILYCIVSFFKTY